MSISEKVTTLNIEYKKDYAIVQIDNGKVNAINTALSKDIKETFLALDKDDNIKGVILTGRPHGFSAGLDLKSLAGEQAEATIFWREYLSALQAMVRFSKPFVCAITGYAPAGGTIFTLCADYRVMGKGAKHVMGMHEFKMSLQIPEMLCDIYAYHLGEKVAWEAVQKAKLFNSDEALEVGLVNESVEVEAVLERAEKYLKRQILIYGKVYSNSKKYFRKGMLAIVNRDIEPMIEVILEDLNDPHTKMMTQMFLASLKKK